MAKIQSMKLVAADISSMARNYSSLSHTSELRDLLYKYLPSGHFAKLKKIELHQTISAILTSSFYGEQTLKYELFKRFRKHDLIGAFEVPINKSRADFLTINGHTSSFEIKSSVDNLQKLAKQSNDYQLAFEFNYVVIDKIHLHNVEALIPKSFGIWSFKGGRRTIYREATLNKKLDPLMQLQLLTKKELISAFGNQNGDIITILNTFKKGQINTIFKLILKKRYETRWNFLLKNESLILPIDLQFFFNTNADPKNIYMLG